MEESIGIILIALMIFMSWGIFFGLIAGLFQGIAGLITSLFQGIVGLIVSLSQGVTNLLVLLTFFLAIIMFLFSVMFVVFWAVNKCYQTYKTQLVEKASFILVNNSQRQVVPKHKSTSRGDDGWMIKTVRPQLTVDYKLEWIEKTYLLKDITVPKDNSDKNKIWQEIGDLCQECWNIDDKKSEFLLQIAQCNKNKKVVASSDAYSEYNDRYEKLIAKIENEIKTGELLKEKIHKLVHEYLIGIEINDVNPIKLIDKVETSKRDYKDLESELEGKYNSLCIEVKSYLEAVDEYAELIKS